MKGLNNKTIKVDPEWEKEMREIMEERYQRKLARLNLKELGMPEATRLLKRCPSWTNISKELRTLPKKRNI
jgi:hypothetical protein